MSKNSHLIALVATAMVVGGERVVFEPGEPLPDLSAKEANELVDTKVARAPVDESGVVATGNSPDPADANAGQAGPGEPDTAKPRTPAKKTSTTKP